MAKLNRGKAKKGDSRPRLRNLMGCGNTWVRYDVVLAHFAAVVEAQYAAVLGKAKEGARGAMVGVISPGGALNPRKNRSRRSRASPVPPPAPVPT